MNEMIPGGTLCARNLPQHFNGCSCTPAFIETREVTDVDLALPDTEPAEQDRDPIYDLSRDEILDLPEFDALPKEWLEPRTDVELAAFVLDSRERKARLAANQVEEDRAAAAETARRRAYRRPAWLHRHEDGSGAVYTTDDGYKATAVQEIGDGIARTRYLVRDPQRQEIKTVDRVEQVQETIETHRGEKPVVLSAPPSTNLDARPFSNANTLEALADHYEALTSPENISWDGERSGAQVQTDFKRLQAAYWVRRDEIDPARERAWCIACRAEVPGKDGEPAKHDNGLGRSCWTGS